MENKLTVLSFGGGQDSTAILYKLIYDPAFADRYKSNRFIVIMSDVGNEHPYTYEHVERIQELCKQHGIEFHFITNDLGYHSENWPGLIQFYERTNTVGSKAFFKTCTDNLKIKVIFNFLEAWIGKNYGFPAGRKKAIKKFAEIYGKIDVMIGFAAGEEGRIGKNENRPIWMQKSINFVYPLIDCGLDRGDCIDYIKEVQPASVPMVYPSNCMICPWLNEVELLWLWRNYPEMFKKWTRLEKAKIIKSAGMIARQERDDRRIRKNEILISFLLEGHEKPMGEIAKEQDAVCKKNLGVWGKEGLNLFAVLKKAIKEYGHMSDADLDEYKLSHGHCIKSKY